MPVTLDDEKLSVFRRDLKGFVGTQQNNRYGDELSAREVEQGASSAGLAFDEFRKMTEAVERGDIALFLVRASLFANYAKEARNVSFGMPPKSD